MPVPHIFKDGVGFLSRQDLDDDFAALPGGTQTSAEAAAGVIPVNLFYVPGDVRRYGAVGNNVFDDTPAFLASVAQAGKAGGSPALWPSAPVAWSVSVVPLPPLNVPYMVQTHGWATKLFQRAGTPFATGQILIVTASNIQVQDIDLKGNIATDTGEFHHGIYVYDDSQTVGSIRNVKLGSYRGTDIRGDVLYVGGTTAVPCTGVTFDGLTGSNVFRNTLSVAGAQVRGKWVVNNGTIGYRDVDVEPNIPGYTPSDVYIGYVQGGIVQVASDDPTLENNHVEFGTLDMDLNRVTPSVPGYPTAPGANAQALLVSFVKCLKVGFFKARNYNFIPVQFGQAALKCNAYFDVVDIANCDITEATFNSLFADTGTGGCNSLEIGVMRATLTATTKMCFNGNGMTVRVKNLKVTGGLLAASIPGFVVENLTHDASGAAGDIISGCSNTKISNAAFTNAAAANLMRNSPNSELHQVTGTFATVLSVNSDDVLAIDSTLNGVKYRNEIIGSNPTNKSGQATFGGGTTVAVAFVIAEGNAAYRVLLGSTANKTFWVTAQTINGFTLNASGASTDIVNWMILRS